MSKRRMVRSPIFEIAPSLCLPPVDFCRGVSPSQAAKSRPARKPSGAGTRAVIAVAAIGPMPGIVISRRATGSAFARWVISASNAWICASKAWKVPINTFRTARALSGTAASGSSTWAITASACVMPWGKTQPYSDRCPRRALMHCVVRCRLLLLAFHRHEAHARALGGFADGLGIRPVVLLPLHVRLDVGRRDQAHGVAQLAELTRPVMRPGAGLHRHRAGRLGGEEFEHLRPHQALAEHHTAGRVCPVRLENPLRNVQSDCVNLSHGRLLKWSVDTTTLARRCRPGASTPSRPQAPMPQILIIADDLSGAADCAIACAAG